MRIKLNNVKQHESLDIDFPETGLIQIKGNSGAGKSTIFEAIFEAITGEADDIASWYGGAPVIEFWLKSPKMYIKRTRNPYTLFLQCEAGDFIDDAAQSQIYSLLGGMDAHIFLASSYIRDLSESLLFLGPAEQLRFIQKLQSSSIDPEEIKRRINEIIQKSANDITVVTSEVDAVKAMIGSTEKNLSCAPAIELPQAPENFESLQASAQNIDSVNAQLSKINSEMDAIRKTLASPYYELVRQDLAGKKTMIINRNDAAIASLKDLSQTDTLALVSEKKNILTKIDRIKVINEMKILAEATTKKLGTGGPLQAALASRLNEVKESINRLLSQISEYTGVIKELKALTEPQACPVCDAGLMVQNGKILKSKLIDVGRELERNNQAVDTAKAELALLNDEQAWIVSTHNKMAELKAKLPSDTMPDIKDIESANSRVQQIDNIISEVRGAINAINTYTNENNKLKDEIKQIKQQVSGDYPPEDECRDKFDSLLSLLKGVQAKLKQCHSDKEALYVYEGKLNNYRRREEERARYTELLLAQNASLSSKLETLDTLNRRITAAKRLREKVDQASVMAIELIINNINLSAKSYIDQMFSDDGTNVCIRNVKALASGDLKPKLSTEISHKGKNVKKISSLSRGEKSRACMAFQLSLGTIFRSPFLLIDEGFTGLPEDQVRACLEMLKSASEDRLIVVIEHGAPESAFDMVHCL